MGTGQTVTKAQMTDYRKADIKAAEIEKRYLAAIEDGKA